MWYILLIFFLVGCIIGSFYYYACNKMCEGESIIGLPRCNNCDYKYKWYECIPVLSYIFLGGKCRKCKIKISKEQIIYELLTGALFTFTYYLYGFDYKTIILLILFSMLIIVYITDFKYMVILNIPLIIGLIGALVTLFIHFDYLFVVQFILRGIVIMLLFLIIKEIGDKVFKHETIGWGDVKLSFFAGLLLGLKLSFIFVVLSVFLTLPYALIKLIQNKKLVFPFGPFLITSMCIIYLLSDEISNIINILLGV